MKRSTPLRRTSSLRTRSTLARSTSMRRTARLRARGNTKHARRERDYEFMGWVKHRTCIVLELHPHLFATDPMRAFAEGQPNPKMTACSGPIEADHMGDRFTDGGDGTRAHDRTCVGICRGHHRERHDFAGTFRPLTRDDMRAWRTAAIEHTQAAWENR